MGLHDMRFFNGLEQIENGLEQTDPELIKLALWKEASALTALENLLYPSENTKTKDIYQSLVMFEQDHAEKRCNGRKETLLNN